MALGGWKRAGVALFALVACAALAVFEVRQAERAMVRSAHRLLARSFGSEVTLDGAVETRLLPRPRLLLHAVTVSEPTSAVRLDIPVLEATPTLTSALLGRADFATIRLIEPTGVIDVDRLRSQVTAFDLVRRLLPQKVAVSGGVVMLKAANPAASGLVTGLDAVVEGLDRNGAAALSGHATWRGQRADMSARLDPFFDFLLGRHATASLHLHLPALSATVDGALSAGLYGGFEGAVTASTDSLDTLLRANGLPTRVGALVNRVAFSATGQAAPDAITFSNARLTLDDTRLEGSLAWQPNGSRGAWTGTFATDALDLTDALRGFAAWDRNGGWSTAPVAADSAGWSDIDFRVSAGQAQFGPFSLEDAALSAQCRNGRLEVGLSEARASDGLVRGRAVASLHPAGIDLKLDLSMAQFDLAPLDWGGAGGVASGHVTAEAHGASPRALVENLAGRGQISIRQGAMPQLRTVADLSSLTAAPAARAVWEAPSGFDLGTADLSIGHGVVSIGNGRLDGEAGEHRFAGQVSLVDQSFSLAEMEEPAAVRSGSGPAIVTSTLAGVLGRPVRVLHMGQTSTPTLAASDNTLR